MVQFEWAALRMVSQIEFCYFFNNLPSKWLSVASRPGGFPAPVNTTDRGRFAYFFRADLATRGLAISFLTPASVALPDSFLALYLGMDTA
ncbi:MAG: hypothetical protein DMG35_05160 [Acidobacteria bacterium]|nr:MAG: hypothetical protein AUH86_11065 [Acidobacteria bacterium 13_1_40CM_4_58_4]PYT63129.1 MAG: hypothetical protein DMG35_05160 [Acidobacteriota bacterium]